ncbi:M48 family metalloprotease [Ekhidna sp.]|uniref:M48 family metalloprotease n=1 Tax=Ekhidna sp. TaxID=2608089 RepID=UPI003CCBF129
MRLGYATILICFTMISFTGCRKTEDLVDFTEEDEILLGEKLSAAIGENEDYNMIPVDDNPTLYGYANSRLQEVVSSSFITKGSDFKWSLTLYEDDTRHAFALPGGKIYISTGMIFYLDNEDQFTGLLAHLVAHINQSHLSERLFFKYGVNGLKSIARSGDQEAINQIIDDMDLRGNFIHLSRVHELQADTLAVSILSETTQSCASANLFHSRVLNIQPGEQAAYITIHGLNQERVDDLENTITEIGCDVAIDDESSTRYRAFRNAVP